MTRMTTDRSAFARPQRGVVMVITLLSVLLLTALILFVLNLGTQVERRIAAQNTADATVTGGSVWVARTMNTVARNNIEMTRMIGLVNVLDAMPRSTAYALHEQTAFHEALDGQLDRGVSRSGPTQLRSILEDLLNDFLAELEDEVDQLETADAFFDSHDTRDLTYYRANNGMGDLWRAMYAMDEMNQAALAEMGRVVQTASVDAGALTYPQDEARAAAFMAPLKPTLPWRRGRFDDFEDPIRHGVLPSSVDDDQTNRGPYDTVFGWHGLISRTVGGTWVPGRSQTAQGGRGGVPIGSGSGGVSGGRRVGGRTIVTGYYVWDMHRHLLDRVSSFVSHELRNSRLAMWVRTMSNAKLNYLWPTGDEPDDDQLARTIAPEWINDWSQAIGIARNERDRIVETGFIAIELKSRYPIDHPRFLEAGTWALVDDGGRWQPRLVRVRGWMDPRDWPAQKVVDHGWRDEWEYTVWYDNDIGIDAMVDEAGNPIAQPVYRIDHFYFAGVNVGEGEDIMDPYEGFDPQASDSPAPSDINHALVRDTPESRRHYLTFFSMAQRNDFAQSWPTAFRGNKPYPAVVAMAQAKVFNNHSWDLWTPMWHARLEPITDLDQWAAVLNADQSVLGDVPNIESADYLDLEAYLNHTARLADAMLGH